MSLQADWNGELPAQFMADLPKFWGGRNNAGKIIIGVPGLVNVVYSAFLPRSLQFRYALEGPALEAARKMVLEQIAPDIAKPRRERSNWVDGWRDVGWAELNAIARSNE